MTARRVDGNQAEIVADLRAIGAMVLHLHTIGRDCPDILVGWRGANYLFEIKRPGYLLVKGMVPKGRLTPKQRNWHARWKEAGGQVDVIRTSEEAFRIMGVEISRG